MKNGMLKKILAGMLAASVVVAMPLTASAAWKQTSGVWQWTENGQNATGWRWIEGAWYHFNASGDMTKGWFQEDGTWYYLKDSGSMAQGWNQVGGKWYCMQPNGAMRTGWVETKGQWYFLAPNGDMQTGVIQVNGETYALSETGVMQTGKVEIDGKTYTFDESGAAKGTAPKADKAFTTGESAGGTGAVEVPVKEPSKPSIGGGSTGGSTPDTPTVPAQSVAVRGRGPGGSDPNYDYPGEYIKAGATFADNTITYTAKSDTIPTELCNGSTAYIGLKFSKPSDAQSVTVSVNGSVKATDLDLTTDSAAGTGIDVLGNELIIYVGFADENGDQLEDKTYNFEFSWKDTEGNVSKTACAVKRESVDAIKSLTTKVVFNEESYNNNGKQYNETAAWNEKFMSGFPWAILEFVKDEGVAIKSANIKVSKGAVNYTLSGPLTATDKLKTVVSTKSGMSWEVCAITDDRIGSASNYDSFGATYDADGSYAGVYTIVLTVNGKEYTATVNVPKVTRQPASASEESSETSSSSESSSVTPANETGSDANETSSDSSEPAI